MGRMDLLTHTSLETHKLDLMAEISSLKLKLAAADRDRHELAEKLRLAQRQIQELETKVTVRDAEVADLRQQLYRNGTIQGPESADSEVKKLKRVVDTLMISNEEKDKRLDDMRRLLKRYRRVEEILVQAQGRKVVEDLMGSVDDDTSSTGSSTTPSISDPAVPGAMSDDVRGQFLSSPTATSTPDGRKAAGSQLSVGGLGPQARQTLGMTRSNSCENISQAPQKTPPTGHRKVDGFGTGYANSEVVTDDEDGLHHFGPVGAAGDGNHSMHKKRKGLRRLLGKLKRSSSQDFNNDRPEEFRRGGVRATATARLGWTKDLKSLSDTSIPFARWDRDRVTAWMNNIGLNMYVVECKRWARNGEQLLRASAHDLEKELGMRNPLHRKKLHLALQTVGGNAPDLRATLDHNWVIKWLDDIGLPQYKDNFYDSRVDGNMLCYLTVEDLLYLKVTNELHHVSIKRGIQILKLNGFNPQCLQRRPSPEEARLGGELSNIPGEVVLWTNHRVMEWLRTIDLSEYAPNLRGSGVHGALMILESRFNAELFAQLLSIPANKTLLRRHISTHYVALIGHELQQKKRTYESSPDYIPLLPNAKVRKAKFGLFGHKRSKSETETESLICPLEFPSGKATNGALGQSNGSGGQEEHAKEIGAVSKEINSLTNMLSQERFLDTVPTSNV